MSSPGEPGDPAASDPRARISPRALRLLLSLLTLSLAANIVALVFFASKPSSTPTTPVTAQQKPTSSSAEGAQLAALQAALASGDPAQLEAAGCPSALVKAVAVGRAFDALQNTIQRGFAEERRPEKYWKPPENSLATAQARELRGIRALGDFNQVMLSTYGRAIDDIFNEHGSRYDFLPAGKRERLLHIEKDYEELEAEIRANYIDGVALPGDREKLAWLREEQERDIAEALTVEERTEIDLRLSHTAISVRGRFGRVLETEEEYKKIYALQKVYDEQVVSWIETPEGPEGHEKARAQAEEQLNQQILELLSPAQITALRQSHDDDRSRLALLAQRLALPSATIDAVVAARDHYATLSQQINADTSLSSAQREARFRQLYKAGETELKTILGSEGQQVYAEHSRWLSHLETGHAFSTNPKDARSTMVSILNSVFPIDPPAASSDPAK